MKNIFLLLAAYASLLSCADAESRHGNVIQSLLSGGNLEESFESEENIQSLFPPENIIRDAHSEYSCYLFEDKKLVIKVYRTISLLNGIVIHQLSDQDSADSECLNFNDENLKNLGDAIFLFESSRESILSLLGLNKFDDMAESIELRISKKIQVREKTYDQFTTIYLKFSGDNLIKLELWQTVTS